MCKCNSRNNMYSVMNHIGFGKLTYNKNNCEITIPNSWINKNGMLKKYAQVQINNLLKKAEVFNQCTGEQYYEV